ncbi:MAG: triose-phosphate isomerase [Bacilli bacterium]
MENNHLVVGNLKMNMVADEISSYLKVINKNIYSEQVVICPSSIYIPYFLKQRYRVGIQNIAAENKGAYTGEVSATQAYSLGVQYALVGHSERRALFNENDLTVNQKVKIAIKNNLYPIICVGETNEDKVMLRTEKILKKQITYALRDLNNDELNNVIIAYEPVWSIGTNKIPSNKDIKSTISYIKLLVENLYGYNGIKVLYGGSVSQKNIKQLVKIDNLDGFLVGGASLNPDEFLNIIEVAVTK